LKREQTNTGSNFPSEHFLQLES